MSERHHIVDPSEVGIVMWPAEPSDVELQSMSIEDEGDTSISIAFDTVPTASGSTVFHSPPRASACPYGTGTTQPVPSLFLPMPPASTPALSEETDELARTDAALIAPELEDLPSHHHHQHHASTAAPDLYESVTMDMNETMVATHAALAIPAPDTDPFSTSDAIPETVEEWTSDTAEHGGFHRRQRINPLAYATIVGALLITAACIVFELDILPDNVVFTYAKLLASPFSNIFAAVMTYLFNDMHGYELTYDAGNGTFEAKRFTALTQCCGARTRTFAALDVYGLSIIYPCGCPDRAVLVFETTKGNIPVARQAHCCRCSVEDLTIEAEFWVRMCRKHGVASEFFGVKTNYFLPAMY